MATGTIFFSYSRSDSAFVLRLAQDLRDTGAELWLDQLDIKAGSRWDASIEAALNSAQYLIIVLSPASVESNNVMDEVSFALENGKTVIPILLSECTTPFRLRRVQRIDFTGDYQIGLNQLSKILGPAGGENIAIERKRTESIRKSNSKKYLLLGGGAVLILIGLWWAINSGEAKTDNEKSWAEALKQNDSISYAHYLKEFPKGVYQHEAKEKLDSIHNKKISDSVAVANKIPKQDSLVVVEKKTQPKESIINPAPSIKTNTLSASTVATTQECPVWQSNLTIIKKTHSNMLGENGKTYTNRAAIRQVVFNIDLNSDQNLNKLKNKLLNLIDTSPSNSDPNYNMEFTQEASLLRNQIEMDIQKHVDKCK